MPRLRHLPSLIALAAAVSFAGAALAQDAAGRWWKDPNSGCEVWNANPQEDDEVRWSGGCSGGRAEGTGLLVWRYRQGETWVSDRYQGEMADGKKNGQGKLETAAGYSYEGSWTDGTLNGQGIAVKPNGERYEGAFENNLPEGRGKLQLLNGALYEGDFKQGLPEGSGKLQLPNGVVYEGGWQAGTKHGKGICRSQNGEDLPCCWERDRAIAC